MSEAIVFSDLQVKAIKGLCNELSASMTRAEAERDFMKEAVSAISKEHEIPKPLLKKMSKIYHKSRFNTVKEENAELEESYQQIFGVTD